MALKLSQQLKLTQQLVMTPQLQMAIKLLQLSRLELMDVIHQEMVENPALEEVSGNLDLGGGTGAGSHPSPNQFRKPKRSPSKNKSGKTSTGATTSMNTTAPVRFHFEGEKKERPNFEAFAAQKSSLKDHLLWQLLMTSPSREDERDRQPHHRQPEPGRLP